MASTQREILLLDKTKRTNHVQFPFHNIHNWPLQPFIQDYDLACYITYVACINFMHEWRGLQFKVDSERQIFEKVFMATFLT